MNYFSSLSATGLLCAHIKQDVSLIFVQEENLLNIPKKIQKYFYFLMVFLGLFWFSPGSSYADEEKYFIVTAYYSPLPGQDFYLRGNYEAEKLLNGNGTNGASGKPVFAGMLAAPKTYAFGTRIVLEGIGVGIVEDRGGAIVTAGNRGQEYDRIDVWMGYGDEGLRRALIWGRRKVKGRITTDTSAPLLSFSGIDSGKINLSNIEKATSSSAGLPAEVTDMFSDLGYTSEGRTAKEMILAFQLDYKIIASKDADGAGNYGPLTKAKLAEEYARYREVRDAEMKKIEAEKSLLIAQNIEWTSTYQVANAKVLSFGSPKKGEKGQHIRELQTVLKENGYLKSKETGVMTVPTVKAIQALQKKHGIKASGTIDESTQEVLVEVMMEKK